MMNLLNQKKFSRVLPEGTKVYWYKKTQGCLTIIYFCQWSRSTQKTFSKKYLRINRDHFPDNQENLT